MILLTGAKGFVASAISKRLDSHIAIDKDDCDLTDYEQVKQLPDNITEVWHFAAYNNTKHFYSKPFDVLDNTLSPTLNLLKRYPNARFVYASSSEVYAGAVTKGIVPVPTPEVNISLIDGIDNPRWSYAGSKLLGEIAVHSAHVQNGIDYLILRYHNVYGADNKIYLPADLMKDLGAKEGDFAYISDTRWYLGGIKSTHAYIGKMSSSNKIEISKNVQNHGQFDPSKKLFIELEL